MQTTEQQLALTIPLLRLVARAGRAILDVYESDDFQTERKRDNSPLTLADRRAHEIIDAGLTDLTPGVPILSEEGHHAHYRERQAWDELWLVDPLDGTKEFIKRNGEFTVNIALVQHGEPVLGVVYAPVREVAWVGLAQPGPVPVGAWTLTAEALGSLQADGLSPAPTGATPGGAALTRTVRDVGTRIAVRTPNPEQITVIASRTHMNEATREFIDRIAADRKDVEIINVGSSLKLCYVAEGRADIYPRYAPTSEWDTAAGHAIVRGAGGEIYQAGPDADAAGSAAGSADATAHPRGHASVPLRYNKEHLLNPWFVVRAWSDPY